MLQIGRKGVFSVTHPFNSLIAAVEHEIVAIQTIAAMKIMGLDPYALIYEPVGFDKSYYQNIPSTTQVYLLVSSLGRRYIPVDMLAHVDTQSYVNYTEKAIVIQVGSHPASVVFNQVVNNLYRDIHAQIGVKPVIEVRDVSSPVQIPSDQHTSIANDRKQIVTKAIPVNTEQFRDDEIKSLTAKIKSLETFLLQYANSCGTEECNKCFAESRDYPDSTVYYQYSLADYYIQALRGDIADLPINNAFITTLHNFFDEGQYIV